MHFGKKAYIPSQIIQVREKERGRERERESKRKRWNEGEEGSCRPTWKDW